MSTGEKELCINCMAEIEEDACPYCGYDNTRPNLPDFLPAGTVIASRYVVGALRHTNSQGGTYMAFDGEAGAPVELEEYFPAAIARRDENGTVVPKPGLEAQYKSLMAEFVDMCNAVKRLSVSDAVIPMTGEVTANNTRYAVYRKLEVLPLGDYLKLHGGKLPVQKAIKMFRPLCETIINLHARGDIHRGISPYTVYIDQGGKLYLGGFALSAVRTENSELTADLYNGYSAPEQYTSNGWQGPWTDVYAMAALFYRCVSGVVPPKSTMVGSQRFIAPLTDMVEDIPPNISGAVADAMGLAAGDRTQTMVSFATQLMPPDKLSATTATAVYDFSGIARGQGRETRDTAGNAGANRQVKDSESGVSIKYIALALVCTVLLLGGLLWFITTTYFSDLIPDGNPGATVSTTVPPTTADTQPATEPMEDKSVPSFVGEEAESIISDSAYQNRFRFEVQEEFNNTVPKGTIYDQAPAAGVRMVNQGTVILYVSKGKQILTMPDLSNMTQEEAIEELKAFEEEHEVTLPYAILNKYAPAVASGKVINTLPAAGTEFEPKDVSLLIYISLEIEVNEAVQGATTQPTTRRYYT